MTAELSGKVALVTGSTRGVGRAIALKLAEAGADIALNGTGPEPAEALGQLRALGRRAIFEKADIKSYAEVKRMMSSAVDRLGHLDILVVSGAATSGPPPQFFREVEPESYEDWVRTYWFSRLYCVRAVLDHMAERGGGNIINISTDAGRWPTPGESMIGGAAAALVMSTKVLAQELARWHIHINTISVALVQGTPALDWALDSPARHVFQKALKKQPFPVTAQDIAQAVLFLTSEAGGAITGQILSVNGGLSFPG